MSSRARPPVATYRGVLMITLIQAILNPSHHLLNVLLQLANKLGPKKKKKKPKRKVEVEDSRGVNCPKERATLANVNGLI
jgi:hypothetical protein